MTVRASKVQKFAAAAVALALVGVATPAAFSPAEAKPIVLKKLHHHDHYGRYIIGALALSGAYEASRSCYWLKVRALRTGSDYWWDRYHDCRGE